MSAILSVSTEYPIRQEGFKSSKNNILQIAQACFQGLQKILSFPLRYLGAKTWSIPGTILRLPLVLFDRMLGRKRELFVQKGYHTQFEKQPSKEEAKALFPYSAATASVYHFNSEYIPAGWKLLSPLDLDLQQSFPDCSEKGIFDSATHFKAMLLEKEGEVILSFGALDGSDRSDPSQVRRSKKTVIGNAFLGGCPPLFRQADSLAAFLRKHPYFVDKKLTLTGSCFGAALASYAALKNGLQAICFNSFPLGAGLQYEIGKEKLEEADAHITHLSAKGDFISDSKWYPLDALAQLLGFKTPGNFGKRWVIPSAYKTSTETHIHITGSLLEYLGQDKKTKPSYYKEVN